MIVNLAAVYEQPDEAIKWFYKDKKRLRELEFLVLEEQIVEKVLTLAQLSKKNISFDEAIQKE
jgi:trigger factor